MLGANTGYVLSSQLIHLFNTCVESFPCARSGHVNKNMMESHRQDGCGVHARERYGGNQPEGAQGAARASRRGSQTVLGEGTIKESVPEKMNSKRRRGVGVHWLEVEGWRRFGERRTACAEPGERRRDRTTGRGEAPRAGGQCPESRCWDAGPEAVGARLEDHLQSSGLPDLVAAGQYGKHS